MDLIGTWTLEAFEVVAGDGTVTTPFGEHPIGRIMYGADGSMSAMLCAADRAPFGARAGEATDAQWADAARRFVAYAGTWTRDGDQVHHDVAVALIPDWVGTTMHRTIGDRNGRLTLTVEPRSPGGRSQRLVWARLG